jgi:hypothetical protein
MPRIENALPMYTRLWLTLLTEDGPPTPSLPHGHLACTILDSRAAVVLARRFGVSAHVDQPSHIASGPVDADDFAAAVGRHALDVDLAPAGGALWACWVSECRRFVSGLHGEEGSLSYDLYVPCHTRGRPCRSRERRSCGSQPCRSRCAGRSCPALDMHLRR